MSKGPNNFQKDAGSSLWMGRTPPLGEGLTVVYMCFVYKLKFFSFCL